MAWILAARPKTLAAALAPVLAGGWLASVVAGSADWKLLGLALGSCLALQLATNLFNDAIDFQKGADDEHRSGPVRATQSGLLSIRQVLAGAGIFLLIAALLAIPLWSARGWPILAIGLPSLYLCFGYTGGPFPLAYLGLGEIFVILFFGLVAVTGSFFVAAGIWSVAAVILGFQIGSLSAVLIAVNNLRDIEGDARAGKRTLAVRFGPQFARIEIVALLVIPYLLGAFWATREFRFGCLLPLLAMPLAIALGQVVGRGASGAVLNRILALSALHLLLWTGLFCLGIFLDSPNPSPPIQP